MLRPHSVGSQPRRVDWCYWQALNIGQIFCHIIWQMSDLSDIIISHSFEENYLLKITYKSHKDFAISLSLVYLLVSTVKSVKTAWAIYA